MPWRFPGCLLLLAGVLSASAQALMDCGMPDGGSVSATVTYTLKEHCTLTRTLTTTADVTVTIEGSGYSIRPATSGFSGSRLVYFSDGALVLKNLTVDGNGVSLIGGVIQVPELHATDTSFRGSNGVMLQMTQNSSATLANVLFADNNYPANGNGSAIYAASSGTRITLTNSAFLSNSGGDAALFVMNNNVSATLNGCFSEVGNFPVGVAFARGASVTDNSTGACSSSIGNNDAATLALPPRAACGLPAAGVIWRPTSYTLRSDCAQTGELLITAPVTINGMGHEIRAAAGSLIFRVSLNGVLNLNYLSTTGGLRSIHNLGTLKGRNLRIHNHDFVAVANSGTTTLRDVILEDNRATRASSAGSAISNIPYRGNILRSGPVTVSDSVLRNNSDGGGALWIDSDGGSLTLEGCISFVNNTPANISGTGVVDNSSGPCTADPRHIPRERPDIPRGPPGMCLVDADGRLNRHCAAPVVAYPQSGTYAIYIILSTGKGRYILAVPDVATLRQQNYGNAQTVHLAAFTNPASGKPVTISYLPASNEVQINTFYADRAPHSIDKPYVFTIDQDGGVNYLLW